MDAVRVPPSAWSTSQSTITVRSPKRGRVHDGAQRAADQPLDFVRPAGGPALDDLARRALGGGARQHGVLRRHPAVAAAAQERRHALFHGSRAEHARIADRDQRRPFGGGRYPVSMSTGRIWSGRRLSIRMSGNRRVLHYVIKEEHQEEKPRGQQDHAGNAAHGRLRGLLLPPGQLELRHTCRWYHPPCGRSPRFRARCYARPSVASMPSHEPFHFESLDQLRERIRELGLGLEASDDVSPLLEPLQVGAFTLPNRLVVLPMEGCDGTADGAPGRADLPPLPPLRRRRRGPALVGSHRRGARRPRQPAPALAARRDTCPLSPGWCRKRTRPRRESHGPLAPAPADRAADPLRPLQPPRPRARADHRPPFALPRSHPQPARRTIR